MKNKADDVKNILSNLPSIDKILIRTDIQKHLSEFSHDYIVHCIRKEVSDFREVILSSKKKPNFNSGEIENKVIQNTINRILKPKRGNLIRAVNATGVVLHTGLGRAPLSAEAIAHIQEVMKGYSVLEVDRESGDRGQRDKFLEGLICFLSGSESAMVVNNNAAAVMLMLNTVARKSKLKEVIISRGELVEIGGSFRMPDIMSASGTKMIEIGTTNKTHLSDYEKAISPKTGAILIVHTSNYRVMGFTEKPSIKEIAELGKKHNIPVIYDLGGGVLFDLKKVGLPDEPVVAESILDGADIVSFSGDKVLGGPQSGIIAGKKKYLDLLKKNPMTRALRCDKMILAGLEGTLKNYLNGLDNISNIPAIKLLTDSEETVSKKADVLMQLLKKEKLPDFKFQIQSTLTEAGSGAMPVEKIKSTALAIESTAFSADKIAAKLRDHKIPIFGFIKDGSTFLDLRSVSDPELQIIADAVKSVHNFLSKK